VFIEAVFISDMTELPIFKVSVTINITCSIIALFSIRTYLICYLLRLCFRFSIVSCHGNATQFLASIVFVMNVVGDVLQVLHVRSKYKEKNQTISPTFINLLVGVLS